MNGLEQINLDQVTDINLAFVNIQEDGTYLAENRITDAIALAKYDRIHIMSYDQTGPWNPSKPGPHAPYEMAEKDFLYFHLERGVPAHKLTLGLPFYGYGFGEGVPISLPYKRILELYPEAYESDAITVPEGGTIYYNGEETISRKVRFAVEQGAGGLMIWHLNGDHAGERSLLAHIQEAMRRIGF